MRSGKRREEIRGVGVDRCTHPKRALIDLASESGDAVCTFCALVVQERLWSAPSVRIRPGNATEERVGTFRNDEEEAKLVLRNIFADALARIQIESARIIDLALGHARRTADNLCVPFAALARSSHLRKFLALALLCAMRENSVFRPPGDVALIMGVTAREIIAAENHKANKWVRRSALFFDLPSDRALVICQCLGLSHALGSAIRQASIELEAPYQGHNPEHFLFEVISEVLSHLNPNHLDKLKVNLLTLEELLQTLSLERPPSRLHIPTSPIVRILYRNKLL